MKKRMLALLLAGMMVFSLAACGGSSDDSSDETEDTEETEDTSEDTEEEATDETEEEATDESTEEASSDSDAEYSISVILKTLASEYWGYVEAGCEAYAEEHPNITIDIKGPTSETAYDEQQNMIETDLNSGAYDAYVISPLQGDTVATLIAGETKPVIACDTDIDADEIVSFVGTGNYDAAYEGAVEAVAAAQEAGWEEIYCVEIAGVQGDATNTARMEGYRDGINDAGGTFLEDEIQYANAVADQAVTSMEAIMQNHPEGLAIVCTNNSDMGVAAAETAADNDAYADTIFLSFDGDSAACESILAGNVTMSVGQEAYDIGYKSCETAVAVLNGEEVEDFVDTGCTIVDISNAQERLDTLNSYLES